MDYWRAMTQDRFCNVDIGSIGGFDNAYMLPAYPGGVPGNALYKMWDEMKNGKTFPMLCQDSGKVHPRKCPSIRYVAEDPQNLIWDTWEATALKNMKEKHPALKLIEFDLEPVPEDGFEQDTREAFAQYAKLKSVPGIQEIKSKYKQQWLSFCQDMNAQILRRCIDMVRKHLPGVKLAPTCEPLRPNSTPNGVDLKMVRDQAEIFASMFYHSGIPFFDNVKHNVTQLKKPQLVLIDPSERMQMYYSRYSPESVRRNLIVCSAVGGAGIGFWDTEAFDGRYYRSIAEAFTLVGRLDPYYTQRNSSFPFTWKGASVIRKEFETESGKMSLTFPDLSNVLRLTSHTAADGKSKLISIFNYDSKQSYILALKVPGIPPKWTIVQDIASGDVYTDVNPSEEMLVRVPAGGETFLEFKEKVSASSPARIITQKQLRSESIKEQARLNQLNTFQEKTSGKSEISWSALPGNSALLLKMRNGSRMILIDPQRGADILSWREISWNDSDILHTKKYQGFLGRLEYYDENQLKKPPYEFTFQSSGFDANHNPYAEFEYIMPNFDNADTKGNPLQGLRCVKTIALENGGRKIRLELRFENQNEKKSSVEIGFRFKYVPAFGFELLGEKDSISDFIRIRCNTPYLNGMLDNKAPRALRVLAEDSKNLDVLSWIGTTSSWKRSPVTVEAGVGSEPRKLRFDANWDLFGGIFFWRDNEYTVELLSKKISLPYGKDKLFKCTIELQ